MQPALVVGMLGFIESIIVAKYYAARHNYGVSPNRELVAIGIANIIGSFFRSDFFSSPFFYAKAKVSLFSFTLLSVLQDYANFWKYDTQRSSRHGGRALTVVQPHRCCSSACNNFVLGATFLLSP